MTQPGPEQPRPWEGPRSWENPPPPPTLDSTWERAWGQDADAPTASPAWGPPAPHTVAGHGWPASGGCRVAPPHPQAGVILALGVLGLFVGVTGPIAWALGNGARRDVAAGRNAPSDLLTAGWVLGIISTILMVVWIVLIVLWVGLALLVVA